MGFRSTFTTTDCAIEWPNWFKEKYSAHVYFREQGLGGLHSKGGEEMHGLWSDLPKDIQRAINWNRFSLNFVIAFLHECGGITRCQIDKDSVLWGEPKSWISTEGATHWHCYGCSDANDAEKVQQAMHEIFYEVCRDIHK